MVDAVIAECKGLERPWLADWSAEQLASEWWPTFRAGEHGSIRRVDARTLNDATQRRRFRERYEGGSEPCLVENANVADWTLAKLRQQLGSLNWRLSDTHGAMIGLDDWFEYASETKDDAPFGLYDSGIFDFDLPYTPPAFFTACHFRALLGPPPEESDDEDDSDDDDSDDDYLRPPWRWVLVGCPRSGTGMHVDPLGTHAWVYLCEGRKLWAMLPPDSDWPVSEEDGGNPGAAALFARHRAALRERPGYVEFVQQSGQLVYVPAGWKHAVLNLEWTLAVTENYAIFPGARPVGALRDKVLRTFSRAKDVFRDDVLLCRVLGFLTAPEADGLASAVAEWRGKSRKGAENLAIRE